MERLHIGTMGWSYDQWVGNFYPLGTKAVDFLSEYAKNFHTVEIDSTFYRVPHSETVKKWKDRTPKTFIFSAKFPRAITHIKMLKDSLNKLQHFIKNISQLGSKLGPLLLQFPYKFKPEEFDNLKDFIQNLPGQYRYVIEVRNKKWLEDRFYSLLRDNGVALALVDHPWMPEMEEITTEFTYIRWEGDPRKIKGNSGKVEKDRMKDIKNWAEKIRKYLDASIEVFGYFSKHYSGHSPTDAKQFISFFSDDTHSKNSTLDRFFNNI